MRKEAISFAATSHHTQYPASSLLEALVGQMIILILTDESDESIITF